MKRPTRLPLAPLAGLSAVALAVGLAACGDTEPPDEASGPAAAASEVTVSIPEFVFDPDPIEINVGDSVVWTNDHSQAHTASGTGDFSWDTGNIAAGESAEPVEFTEAGSFTYRCALHPFMTGTVTVAG